MKFSRIEDELGLCRFVKILIHVLIRSGTAFQKKASSMLKEHTIISSNTE